MKVFLSFNSKDHVLAEHLRTRLAHLESQFDVFFSALSLGSGFWLPRLAEEIKRSDAFLLLLGPHGVGPWQAIEYHEAFDRHVIDRQFRVVPVICAGASAPGLPFLRQLNWIQLDQAANVGEVARLVSALTGDPGRDAADQLWRLVNPYLGLEAMTEANADYFYGRTSETVSVIEKLAGSPNRLPVLIGSSGVGKSSVAQAGVLSCLKSMSWPQDSVAAREKRPWPTAFGSSRRDWAWLQMRPGEDPLQSLASTFIRMWENDPKSANRAPLIREWATGLAKSNTLVDLLDATEEILSSREGKSPRRFMLYIDQAEELYAQSAAKDPARAARFSELLARSLDDKRMISFASMRSDYFGRLQADAALFSKYEHIDIPPLNETQLRAIVERPASALGAKFEDASIPTSISRAAHGAPGALPLVSYLLADMWSAMARQGDGVLRLPARAIDVGGVLAARAEEFLHADPACESDLRRLLTLRLAIMPAEGLPIRRRARQKEIAPAEWRLAEKLAEAPWRLVVMGERDQGGDLFAEVAHEALLTAWPRLGSWFKDEREFLVFKSEVEREERRWRAAGRINDALLRGLDLALAEGWLRKRQPDLSADVSTFVGRSVEADATERDKRLRFQRRVSIGASLSALALAAIGSVAVLNSLELTQKNTDLDASRKDLQRSAESVLRAQSRHLAEAAYGHIRKGDAATGLLYALAALPEPEALGRRPGVPEAERALLAAGQGLRELSILSGHQQPITRATFDSTGGVVVTSSLDATAIVWNVQTGRATARLVGHSGPVNAVAISRDSQFVVSASADHTARIWDLANGRLLTTLEGHEEAIWAIAVSPDGRYVATGSEDRTVGVFDARTGKLLHRLKGHYDVVWDVQFSPSGDYLASASEDGTARLWKVEDGSLVRQLGRPFAEYFIVAGEHMPKPGPGEQPITLESDRIANPGSRIGHVDVVNSVRFSQDGRHLVTASRDWTAIVWDARTGHQLSLLYEHQRDVRYAEFSPDGNRVITASGSEYDATDNTVRLWPVKAESSAVLEADDESEVGGNKPDGSGKGSPELSLPRFARPTTNAVLGDSRHTTEYDRSDTSAAFRKGHAAVIRKAVFSPDGNRIASASDDGTARVWDSHTGLPVATLRGHRGPISGIEFSPDGKRVVTAGRDGTARIWNAEFRESLAGFRGHTGGVMSARFSPDGRRLVSASEDGTARLWSIDTGEQIASVRHRETVWSGRFSRDGRLIVTASEDRYVRLIDAETGRVVVKLGKPIAGEREEQDDEEFVAGRAVGPSRPATGHVDQVRDAIPSPDGKVIISVSDDNSAWLWSAHDGAPIAQLRGHLDTILAADFSPDSTMVATGSRDGTALVWNARTGELITEFAEHSREVHSVRFSPDGKWIASASGRHSDSRDNSVRIWNPATGDQRAIVNGLTGRARRVAFHPDGTKVAIAGDDPVAVIADAASGKILSTLTGHEQAITQISFSPGGDLILTASADATARLYDVKDARLRGVLTGHEDTVWSAEFSSDGRYVATGSQDLSVRVWDVETGKQVVHQWYRSRAVREVKLSPDGKLLAVATDDGAIRIWSHLTGKIEDELMRPGEKVVALAWITEGRSDLLTAKFADNHTLDIWQAGAWSTRSEHGETNPLESIASALASTRNQQKWVRLEGSSYDNSFERPLVFEEVQVRDRKITSRQLIGHNREVTTAAFTRDDRQIVTGSRDGTIRLWDARTGVNQATLVGHQREIRKIALDRRNQRIVSVGGGIDESDNVDNAARVWDLKTGKLLLVLEGHSRAVTDVAVTSNGTIAVTSSFDGTAIVWDLRKGIKLHQVTHGGRLTHALLSSDEQTFLTAGTDGLVRLWRVADGASVGAFGSPERGSDASVVPAPFTRTTQLTTSSTELEALVEQARQIAPRCLTPSELVKAFLPPEPPHWCVKLEKWPYRQRDPN